MLKDLTTEKRNELTMDLDNMSIEQFLRAMNSEDAKVASTVREQIPNIIKAVEVLTTALRSGRRLIYIGAGTSGRIGLLDAVECPPTFGTDSEQVLGLIAGGKMAFVKAVEGAEDNIEYGEKDLESISLNKRDVVVGIAASGRTPYVIGGLNYANSIGAETVAISCNLHSEIGEVAKVAIEVDCGPEVLTGSTRLKAGTAQKMICNMLSTASMIGIGKTYGNLMVDLKPTNKKLEERSKSIIMEATSCDYKIAEEYLDKAQKKPKVAIIMLLTSATYEEAIQKLDKAKGFVHKTL